MECRRIVVKGRVQGVGFRAFVASSAAVHGVVGEVWNTRDSDVEIIACAESLEAFVAELSAGPGRVDNVSVSEHEPISVTSFRISSTR